MRAQPIAKVQLRKVPVYSTTRKRVEMIPSTVHRRLCLMQAAVEAGLEQPAGTVFWGALAPLRAPEREGVRAEVTRLLGMKPEERSAELVIMRAQGNIP